MSANEGAREPDFKLRSVDEVAQKPPKFGEKVLALIKRGYKFIDGGVTPQEIPAEQISDREVAQAIKDQRIEWRRSGKPHDPDRARLPISITTILLDLGYKPGPDLQLTDPEAYGAVRRGVDNLVREGGLEIVPAKEGHPDNQQIEYIVSNPDVVLEKAAPVAPVENH